MFNPLWRDTEGPWNGEPDHLEFTSNGFPCIAKRNPILGNWCGYVGVPVDHPWFDKHYDAIEADVHGGLTYADHCNKDAKICHEGPEERYWVGFDCAHAGDLYPSNMSAYFPSTYKDLEWVKAETSRLAEQAAAL